MKKLKYVLALLAAFGVGPILFSCDGRAERAGEKIDKSLEKAGDKVKDATDRK